MKNIQFGDISSLPTLMDSLKIELPKFFTGCKKLKTFYQGGPMKVSHVFFLFLLTLTFMSCGSKNKTAALTDNFSNQNQLLQLQNLNTLKGHYQGEKKYVDFSTYNSSMDLQPVLSNSFQSFDDQTCQNVNAQKFLRSNGLNWKDLDVEITDHLLIEGSKVTLKQEILSYYQTELVGVKCNKGLKVGTIQKNFDNAFLYFISKRGKELTYEIYKSNGKMILTKISI